jgi:hypothetical protein
MWRSDLAGGRRDRVREVAPRDAYAVHDGTLNDIGAAMVEGFPGERGPGSQPAITG